jgi:hypothetical protein
MAVFLQMFLPESKNILHVFDVREQDRQLMESFRNDFNPLSLSLSLSLSL